MRAAVLQERGGTPVVVDHEEPSEQTGAVLIDVDTAGLGGWDVVGAYRESVDFPCVVRGEGVGRDQDGRRVYFGERSVLPFGALAERTVVPAPEVWEVPDGVDDATAITMAIAGTGALLPLEATRIEVGDRVLVVGGTGALGRIALPLARHFGAGRVVAAARDADALADLKSAGIADDVVTLTGEDDAARLRDASGGDGFDAVLDLVYGAPLEAAIAATRWGARIVNAGTLAGRQVTLGPGALLFRTLTTIGTGQRTPAEREQIWHRLLQLSTEVDLSMPTTYYALEDAATAWQAQVASPHGKVIVDIR